jgi:formamidopyrimidine-DNA glycosylase
MREALRSYYDASQSDRGVFSMPELPEVEVFRRFVERYVVGKRIQGVQVFEPRILQGLSPSVLEKAVNNGKVTATERRGKQLFVQVQQTRRSVWLLFHFGMTGYFSWFDDEQTVINAYGDPGRKQSHIRVQFDLDDGSHWAFHEQRMFGRLGLIDDLNAYLEASGLGPDAVDPRFDEKAFREALGRCKGQIKPALMNQSVIAGIGNVYADEMLYQSGIHPERRVVDLSSSELQRLYREMKDVLQKTIDCKAERECLPKNYLIHFRRAKALCPCSPTPVSVKTIGGRTTYFCPKCQK